METPRPAHSATFGEDLDLVYLRLLKARVPYEQCQHELLKLEKHWLRKARTEAQRLSVRRAIASTLLTEAYGARRPWKDFGTCLRRLQRIGFADLGMRVHVVCLYVQSAHRYPETQAQEAWEMWDETERRVHRLRRGNPLREEHLEALAHAKKTAQEPRPSSG